MYRARAREPRAKTEMSGADWTPKESRRMFKMQVEITMRGASLLVPGGHLVYSTCSIDPVENEAVVAEVLRRCPYLGSFRCPSMGLTLHPGLTRWPLLDEVGAPVDSDTVEQLPFLIPPTSTPQLALNVARRKKAWKTPSSTNFRIVCDSGTMTTTPGDFLSPSSDTNPRHHPKTLLKPSGRGGRPDEPRAGPQPSSLRQNQPPIPWSSLKTVLYIIWRRCTEWH